jgi:hypothetical protein
MWLAGLRQIKWSEGNKTAAPKMSTQRWGVRHHALLSFSEEFIHWNAQLQYCFFFPYSYAFLLIRARQYPWLVVL